MPRDAGSRVVPKDAREPRCRGAFGPVGDDCDARVLRISHTHAAAVMQRNPRCAARHGEHRVEQRPVADRIAAVAHAFGFAIGARDRAAIEMIASDDDRCREFAARDHLVEGESDPIPVAETDPANTRG